MCLVKKGCAFEINKHKLEKCNYITSKQIQVYPLRSIIPQCLWFIEVKVIKWCTLLLLLMIVP